MAAAQGMAGCVTSSENYVAGRKVACQMIHVPCTSDFVAMQRYDSTNCLKNSRYTGSPFVLLCRYGNQPLTNRD